MNKNKLLINLIIIVYSTSLSLIGCTVNPWAKDGVLDKDKNQQLLESATEDGYYEWTQDIGTHSYAPITNLYLRKDGFWYKWIKNQSSNTQGTWELCSNNYPMDLLHPTEDFKYLGRDKVKYLNLEHTINNDKLIITN